MTDDQRYSDEQFALILRKAAELQAPGHSLQRSGGLTLEEMKEIAAEAGIDPALVERAASLLPRAEDGGTFQRLSGGPVKYRLEHTAPVELTDDRMAALATALRAAAEHHGLLDTNATGLEWRTEGEVSQLFVTATKRGRETHVAVAADRTPAAILTLFFNVLGGVLLGAATGAALEPDTIVQGAAIVGTGAAAGLTSARLIWSKTTRSLRNRLDRIMDAAARTLANEPDEGHGG